MTLNQILFHNPKTHNIPQHLISSHIKQCRTWIICNPKKLSPTTLVVLHPLAQLPSVTWHDISFSVLCSYAILRHLNLSMCERGSDVKAQGCSAEGSRGSGKFIPEPQSGKETHQYKLPWRPGKQERSPAEQSMEEEDQRNASSMSFLFSMFPFWYCLFLFWRRKKGLFVTCKLQQSKNLCHTNIYFLESWS